MKDGQLLNSPRQLATDSHRDNGQDTGCRSPAADSRLAEATTAIENNQSEHSATAVIKPLHSSPDQSGHMSTEQSQPLPPGVLIRHEGHTPRERSQCGWRDRLISREDIDEDPVAWAHAVDIDGAALHYHKRSTELYYVLDGAGSVSLDGVNHPVSKGSLIQIPPGVVHGAEGRMRVLVVGIPDIAEDDYFEAESASPGRSET